MNAMRRRIFLETSGRTAIAACFLPFGGCATRQRRASGSKDDWKTLLAALEKRIPEVMEHQNVPGVSLAIVKDGQLFWRRAFGVKSNATKEPVNDNTVFEAASVSKTVFAYAAMKLCEKGVIGLDTPLTRYSPKPFLDGDPRLEQITARHVLSHTGGFQDWRSGEQPLKIHFAPGENFSYSGEGYFYLQSVMTHLTGRVDPAHCAQYEAGYEVCATDIDDYMRRNLLGPFGMASSGYVWKSSWEKHAAQPHDSAGKPSAKSKPSATAAARYASAGGLHTTSTDYAKFLIEIVRHKPPDSFRLNAASLREMLRPQVKLPDNEKIDGASAWALGWAVQEHDSGNVIVHSGGQAGFRSLAMASVERKSGFIILTNSDRGGMVFNDPLFTDTMNRLLAG